MPNVLMIDNYDSFTFNLVQYLGELGAALEVVRNDQIGVDELLERRDVDGIVLSPGPCTPNEAGICLELVERLSGRLPILGVCLGHQAIAQAFGGRIIRAATIMHGKTSELHHDGRGLLRRLPNPSRAPRCDGVVAHRTAIPEVLEVTARTSDGEVMGLRHRQHPTAGIQFHPESILTVEGKRLLANFLASLERVTSGERVAVGERGRR
ncbi:MAG: aminodeoxychorismate/anthranilate synthase component II [Myxococcales bacterium]|nr:aminodeoxychorismate/anthranilate synthase component II [Myxococcales bacterium]